MMPYCEYKRCKRVAALRLGDRIGTGGDYYSEHRWEQVVYLCTKHYVKVMVALGRDKSKVEADVAEHDKREAEYAKQ